jgi:YHS domain-containing protein
MGWFSRLFGGGKEEEAMKMEPGGMKEHPAEHTPMAGMKTATDPVCGMEVDMGKAAATSVHQGQTYYFCAVGCKKSFDQNPAKYLMGKGEVKGDMPGH